MMSLDDRMPDGDVDDIDVDSVVELLRDLFRLAR